MSRAWTEDEKAQLLIAVRTRRETTWKALAQKLGSTPGAVRKLYARLSTKSGRSADERAITP